jgi:hypothetical protein
MLGYCLAIKIYIAELPSYQKYVAELPGSHWGQSIGSQDAWLLPGYQKICNQTARLSKKKK